MNMQEWLKNLRKNKRTIPILSFPAIQLLNCSLTDFLNNSSLQAKGMQLVVERCQTGVGIGMMDLSIEAECFGADIKFDGIDIPTVCGALIKEDATLVEVPPIQKRAKIYIDGIKQARKLMPDIPILAGMIGPFSLAGRLLDVSEAMILCYDDPDLVHEVLSKATEFLIQYGKELKQSGANGIILAEPLAGILSPMLVHEFSSEYVQKIVKELQTDDFIIIYHNCGNNVLKMVDAILSTGCSVYHFGNAIHMKEMLEKMPKDKIVMGNIDPVGILKDGSIDMIEKETNQLLKQCEEYDNFILSSGCDIPYTSSWENLDCFIKTGNKYYEK